jgi:hypothetical protein
MDYRGFCSRARHINHDLELPERVPAPAASLKGAGFDLTPRGVLGCGLDLKDTRHALRLPLRRSRERGREAFVYADDHAADLDPRILARLADLPVLRFSKMARCSSVMVLSWRSLDLEIERRAQLPSDQAVRIEVSD